MPKPDEKAKKALTTIQVEKELAEMLRGMGNMNDTYSSVIRRLIGDKRKPGQEGPGRNE